jgi:hypothetical protein
MNLRVAYNTGGDYRLLASACGVQTACVVAYIAGRWGRRVVVEIGSKYSDLRIDSSHPFIGRAAGPHVTSGEGRAAACRRESNVAGALV